MPGLGVLLNFFTNNLLPLLGTGMDYQARQGASRTNEAQNQSAVDVVKEARWGPETRTTNPDGSVTVGPRTGGQGRRIEEAGARERSDRMGALGAKQGTVDRAIGDYKRAVTGDNSMEARTGRAGSAYIKDIDSLSADYFKTAGGIADKRITDVKDMMSFIGEQTTKALQDNPALQQINEDRKYFKDEFGNIKATLLGDVPQTRSDLDKAVAQISFKGEQDVLKAADAPAAEFGNQKALLDKQLMTKAITPAQYQAALEQARTQKTKATGDARQAIVASNYNSYTTARLAAETSFMSYKNNIFSTLASAQASTIQGVTALDAQSASLSSEVLASMRDLGGKAIDQVGAANDILAAANKDGFAVKSGARSAVFDDIVKAINTDGAIAGQIADMTIQNANEDLAFNAETYSRATAATLAAVDNDKYWATMEANIHKDWDIMVPQIMDLITSMGAMSNNWQTIKQNSQALDQANDAAGMNAVVGTMKAGASLAAPFAASAMSGGAGGTLGSIFGGGSTPNPGSYAAGRKA